METTTRIPATTEKTFRVLAENWPARETKQTFLLATFGTGNEPEGVSLWLKGGRYSSFGMKPHIHIEGRHRKNSRHPFRRVFGKVERVKEDGEVWTYITVSLEEVRAKVAELAAQDAEIVQANERSAEAYRECRKREETLKKKLGVAKGRVWTTEPEYEIPGIHDLSADYTGNTFSARPESFSGLTEEQVVELAGLLREFRRKVRAPNTNEE
jgi:hypothetical protein